VSEEDTETKKLCSDYDCNGIVIFSDAGNKKDILKIIENYKWLFISKVNN
jgi:hypothetical protein